jgi:N-acetylglutamate synthase-like GNAT family acetyltransferase
MRRKISRKGAGKMRIYELKEKMELFNHAVEFFWNAWGTEANQHFYKDCMFHSCYTNEELPRFYIMVNGNEIIASYALLRTDFISRQDLMPWFSCLYVKKEWRGNGLGQRLLTHGSQKAKEKGFYNLYLSTELEDYYEKYGWDYMKDGYSIEGEKLRIYVNPSLS